MTTDTRYSHSLRSALLVGSLCLVAAQEFFLSQSFRPQVLIDSEFQAPWYGVFRELGHFLKILFVFVALAGILMHERLKNHWSDLVGETRPRRTLIFLILNLLAFSALYFTTWFIFEMGDDVELNWNVFITWAVLVLLTLLTGLGMIFSRRMFSHWIRQESLTLIGAAAGAFVISYIALWTRQLWEPMSYVTFSITVSALQQILPGQLEVDHAEKIIGAGNFFVQIDPACSGYEGIGLVLAFMTVFLYVSRKSLRFPQALLLVPLGIVAIWLLNIVRIIALILVGHYISEEIAMGGFHSQAGWITFILTSVGLLWLAHSLPFFTRTAFTRAAFPQTASPQETYSHAASTASPSAQPAISHEAQSGQNLSLPVASLVPVVVLLSAILFTSAFTAGFAWLYPLRVIAVGAALVFIWPHLRLPLEKLTFKPVLAGIVCAGVWILTVKPDAAYDSAFASTLQDSSVALAAAWLLVRLIGAVITVPIAEELAFRGYLLSRLSGEEVKLGGALPVSVVAIALSSIAFGALHGAWFAGTLAGLIFCWVRIHCRSTVAAIYAHGITNFLVFVFAAITGQWILI